MLDWNSSIITTKNKTKSYILTWRIWTSCPQLSPASFSRARLTLDFVNNLMYFANYNITIQTLHYMQRVWVLPVEVVILFDWTGLPGKSSLKLRYSITIFFRMQLNCIFILCSEVCEWVNAVRCDISHAVHIYEYFIRNVA